MKPKLAAFIILCIVCVHNLHAQATEYPFSPGQQKAVGLLLADSSHGRLAVSTDCVNPFLTDYKKERPGYLPYFCVGDFDGDGRPDFVVALRTGDRFDLFLFRATTAGYRKRIWFASLTWLPDCGFFESGGRFQVMKFYSDDGTTFFWDRKKGKFVPESEDE